MVSRAYSQNPLRTIYGTIITHPFPPPPTTEYLLAATDITSFPFTIAKKNLRLSTCHVLAYLTAIRSYVKHFLSKLPIPTLLTVNIFLSTPQHASYILLRKTYPLCFPACSPYTFRTAVLLHSTQILSQLRTGFSLP